MRINPQDLVFFTTNVVGNGGFVCKLQGLVFFTRNNLVTQIQELVTQVQDAKMYLFILIFWRKKVVSKVQELVPKVQDLVCKVQDLVSKVQDLVPEWQVLVT